MAINQPSRNDLDYAIRTTLVAVRTALDNVAELKAQLDAITDDTLTASGGGYEYTTDDVSNIRSSLADLDHLRQVATGEATQQGASDFFTFPRRIWGINRVSR